MVVDSWLFCGGGYFGIVVCCVCLLDLLWMFVACLQLCLFVSMGVIVVRLFRVG